MNSDTHSAYEVRQLTSYFPPFFPLPTSLSRSPLVGECVVYCQRGLLFVCFHRVPKGLHFCLIESRSPCKYLQCSQVLLSELSDRKSAMFVFLGNFSHGFKADTGSLRLSLTVLPPFLLERVLAHAQTKPEEHRVTEHALPSVISAIPRNVVPVAAKHLRSGCAVAQWLFCSTVAFYLYGRGFKFRLCV